MKRITSSQNLLFKELKQLSSKSAARRKAGRTLLEGVHATLMYLDNGLLPRSCITSEGSLSSSEVNQIILRCQANDIHVIVLDERLYRSISTLDSGVGLMFVIDVPVPSLKGPVATSSVLLDRLQDPGNLGTMLRSAAAAGIKQIYCSPGTTSAWSPKVLRAGQGAHFDLEIYENIDLLDLVKTSQVPVAVTSSHATDSIYQADLSRPLAWIFGSEGEGVRTDLTRHAGLVVKIPHEQSIESLNVSIAAAICMFEHRRQLIEL